MKEDLIEQIKQRVLPQHVGLIMDGSGRWAERKGLPRVFGHKNSTTAVKDSIKAFRKLEIPYLTLYAFSSENWNRPQVEIDSLMSFLATSLLTRLDELQVNGIRLLSIGEIEGLPLRVKENLLSAIEKTTQNKNGTLILALNYGSQAEILRASKIIAKKVLVGELFVEDINLKSFQEHLYTQHIPAVDLIIRTSGEKRISNFLLWQAAYAEFYFTEILWPDFREKDFLKAILEYQSRERRFGKLKKIIQA